MSRAFTKEDDAGDDLPEKPVPQGPNYVTPHGMEMLRAAVRELVAKRAAAADPKPIDRDLRYLEARINSAIVVPRGVGPQARFGARVTLEDSSGARKSFTIVGEDEARTDPSLMPWSAPLAQAVLGTEYGDTITWESEQGTVAYRVVAVEY